MATPALKAVRTRFPGAQIAWLVKPYGKKAIENLPFCDEILEYDDAPGTRRVLGLLSWAMRLRRKEFDLAIILPNSFSSALMVFLAGIKRRVGYSRDTRGFMLTDSIKPVRENSRIVPVPMVEYYLRITDSLGCPRVTTSPELSVSLAAKEKAHAMLDRFGINQKGMTVAMIPGAAYGSSKCWKPEYFAQAADQLTDRYGCHVLILPGPEEVEIAKDIEKRMHHGSVVFADPIVPLDVLMAVIQFCSLVITNDTGPRHFAVALKKPVVVIMGPTDPRYTNSNLEKTVVLREDLECSPCHLKICPRDHRCMTAITPDRVVQACEQLLENTGKAGKRVIQSNS